jgi:hypothetical protein
VTAFVHLPAGDSISAGPIAGTSGAVKRPSWAMHGVAGAGAAAEVRELIKMAARLMAEIIAGKEASSVFMFFGKAGLIGLFGF